MSNSNITFVIPNRGGKHIDFVIGQLRRFYPNEKFMVISQEDNEPFKRGQLFNVAYDYTETEYLCFIDNDIFFKNYVDLIGIYKKNNCQVLMPFNVIEQVELVGDTYRTIEVGKPITFKGSHSFGKRGGISFVSKKVFEELKGFSTILIGYGYEDNEFATRCKPDGFRNIDNHICHIKHPARDMINIHRQLNCVLFNNENRETQGSINTITYKEVFRNNVNGVDYIGVTEIGTTLKKAKELLLLHKPENIRKACEYICDYYIKKYVTSNYVLLGVPKHMNIGDTLIWEAEKELLDKLPHKRIATFFFGTYMHHIKITPNDVIVFSGGGYLNDIWDGSLEYVNKVLETFPNNKVVFLPNSVHRVDENNVAFKKLITNIKNRKQKPIILSREYQSFEKSKKLFGSYVVNELIPDVVLSWDIKKYINDHKNIYNVKDKKNILFINRNDRERIENKVFKYDVSTDWLQLVKRPAYADTNMRCVDWERDVKDRLIMETISFVDSFNVVYSNRMHGAILAWLLGKETYLINNTYGKSKSLYETWLSDDKKIKMVE